MNTFIPFTPEQVVLLRNATLIDNAEARALLDLDPQPDNIAARILEITGAAIDANSSTRRDALIQIQHICLQASRGEERNAA